MRTESDFDELVRYLEGELTQSRAKELEASPDHVERVARVKRALDELRATDPALEKLDLVPSLHEATSAVTWRARPRWHRATPFIVLAAAGLAGIIAMPPSIREDDDGFRAKGAAPASEAFRWAGVEVYRVAGEKSAGASGTIGASDAVAFAYRNGGERPFSYLMVFAVDEQGRVFWFYPAWTDARENPGSVPIGAAVGPVELPEVVRHDFAPGPLVVHALFSRRPFSVLDIEQRLATLEQLPEVFDQRQSLVVQP